MADRKERRPITYNNLPDFVIRQKQWTEDELRAKGYEYFERIKEVTLVRELPPQEAPMEIKTSWGDTLIATAGYMICYRAGMVKRTSREDYEHWPVEPSIFAQTYKPWDEEDWKPNPAENYLLMSGCQPYYKSSGVWARKLDEDAYLLSLEHERPVKVRTGQYVAIGVDGEPYSMGDNTLHSRYTQEAQQVRSGGLFGWLRRLFG